MVDVISVVFLMFGLISVFKPEWVAAVHRRQKATGTTHRPREIEVTNTWLAVTRMAGLACILVGLLFTLGSL